MSYEKTMLQALVNLHREADGPVKAAEMAKQVDRAPGTIRSHMQHLKTLQLVEGMPGPKGGYKPTAAAYDALERQAIEHGASVPLFHNNERVSDANVERIDFTSVYDPNQCRAEIHIQGALTDFHEGDTITVGPTPVSDLQIRGTLAGKDSTTNSLILTIDEILEPAEPHDILV